MKAFTAADCESVDDSCRRNTHATHTEVVMARFESLALTAVTIGTFLALLSNVWASVLSHAS